MEQSSSPDTMKLYMKQCYETVGSTKKQETITKTFLTEKKKTFLASCVLKLKFSFGCLNIVMHVVRILKVLIRTSAQALHHLPLVMSDIDTTECRLH